MKSIISIDDNYNNDINSLILERVSINDKYNNTNNNPFGNWSKEDHGVLLLSSSSLLLLLLLL
jgi:hypothetical protein